jgi:chromosome partitioning protein
MPVQAELLAYESVPAMLKRYMAIKKAENITSYIQGILVTMFSGRTNMSNQVYQRLCESYHGLVFSQPIPMLQEARNSTETRSSLISRKSSKIGQAYMAAVREIIRRDSK